MPYNYKTELERYRRYYQSLEPILKKPRSQSYTAVVFSFLAVSLFGWYAIRPTIQTILTLKREIQDKTSISQKMEEKISALIEAQAAYSQVVSALPVIDEALPSSPDAIPLIIQLRNLANVTGVSMTAIQVPALPLVGNQATVSAKTKDAPTTSKSQSFELSITVAGDYGALKAYLDGLRSMRRITIVNSLSVTPEKSSELTASGSATPANPNIQLALRLTSYYLVE